MSARDEAALAFERSFGARPQDVAFAPGRVNLIGDHVDYNDGFVLPMPLALGTAVAWRRRDDGRVAVQAADMDAERYLFALDDLPPERSGWRSLVHGMISLMHRETTIAQGLDLLVKGDLPRGAGLSSSASLCVATGRAVMQAEGTIEPDPTRIARTAQLVEHRFSGVACGIMDQMAIAAGEPGCAMLLDCRSLKRQRVDIPADWSVLIVQSGVSRELIDGEYNARRKQCESAAQKLGVSSLRDICAADADLSCLDPVEARRARHVVSEIERTQAAAGAIARGAIDVLGGLMRSSHVSMRDDFEASHPEVDRQVALLNRAIGLHGGARMTGGGFGGAIVAICRAAETDRLLHAIQDGAGRDASRLQATRAFN